MADASLKGRIKLLRLNIKKHADSLIIHNRTKVDVVFVDHLKKGFNLGVDSMLFHILRTFWFL